METAARRQNVREALINAAERAITADGLRGLKARALADEAGCAVGAIYNVFGDLDDIVLAVNLRTLAALEQAVTAHQTVSEPQDTTERLVAMALAYLDYAATNKMRWRTLFQHHMPPHRTVPDWYMAELRRMFGYIEEPLRALRPNASIDERALLARSLFSAVHGIAALGMEEKLEYIPLETVRDQMKLMVEAMGRGLASE
jgi:AcrR family transcriptional regulator